MKNFKRKLAGFLIFAMMLGIMAPGMTVQAAAGAINGIDENYATEEVTVKYASMAAIYFADTKYDISKVTDWTTVKKADDNWKIKTWETVEGVTGATSASIDISWVKKNKPAYIVIKAVDTDGTEHYEGITTPVQETKLKVGTLTTATGTSTGKDKTTISSTAYSVGGDEVGYLYFYTEKGAVSTSSIQWRKGTSGEWQSTSNLASKLPMFKAKGATLYFRIKGDSNTWPSKEVKFSYKKQANAPKVKVDVSKYTLAVKDTMEYKLDRPGAKWIAVPDKAKSINVTDLKLTAASTTGIGIADDLYNGNGIKVFVRTEANKDKGTIPSKITEVVLESVSPATITVATTAALAKSGLVVNYTTAYDEASGISIKNYTDKEYEYMLVTSGTTIDAKVLDPDSKTVGKWSKISKGATDKAKEVKIKNDKLPKDAVVLLRLVGDKKAELLAGKISEINVKNQVNPLAQVVASATPSKNTFTTTTSAVNGEYTITVSGAAVASNAAVELDLTIVLTGLTVANAKVSDIEDCDEIEVPKAAADNKVIVKINVPAGEKGDQEATFTVEGVKIKVKLAIAKATN